MPTSHRTPAVLLLLPVLLAGVACAGMAYAQQATFEFTDSGQGLGNRESTSVALGDLDGDGDIDAMVANGALTRQPNTVWTSDGNGNFTNSGQALGKSSSLSVAFGDLDGDGDLDAMVANGALSRQPNTVWTNDGTGIFTNSGQALGKGESRSVALGDLDGDGDLDAMVANMVQPNTVWINDGKGTFTNSGQALGKSSSKAVALGDLDGDGDLDAMVANSDESNTAWINDGNGAFTDSGQALGNNDSGSVSLGDLDGDGDLDAMFANYGMFGQPNTLWINDGNGMFTDSGQALGNMRSCSVALGDLDGDGDLDAMIGNLGPNTVWTNDGNGIFTESGQALGSSFTYEIDLGDLDGDGALDAMFANIVSSNNTGDGDVTVWTNVIQGACCIKGVCVQLQADLCTRAGGTYLGGDCNDTICSKPVATGACCVSSGCAIVTEDQCTGFGGTWKEDGSCDDCPTT